MRTPCKIILASALALLPATSQEEEGHGFLNVVNLIPGTASVDVTIAGKTLLPNGLEPGSATGWFMVPAGDHTMSIALDQPEDAEPRIRRISGQIPLVDGVSNVIVIYLHPSPSVRQDGTPFPPIIRIRSFPAFDGRGYAMKVISTCAEIQRFQIGPNLVEATPLEAVEISNWAGGAFDIVHNGQVIGKADASTEPGSFFLFVGNHPAGGFVTVLTRAGTQSAPPWMRKRNERNTP
ncbi:MAG: hypothetical protein ACNA8L_01200 [Luteolibacter sp.]|jgi:hypothetical protein